MHLVFFCGSLNKVKRESGFQTESQLLLQPRHPNKIYFNHKEKLFHSYRRFYHSCSRALQKLNTAGSLLALQSGPLTQVGLFHAMFGRTGLLRDPLLVSLECHLMQSGSVWTPASFTAAVSESFWVRWTEGSGKNDVEGRDCVRVCEGVCVCDS